MSKPRDARRRPFDWRCAAILIGAALTLVSANSAHAQQPFFMGLGDLPGGDFWSQPTDISADGSIVGGASRNGTYSFGPRTSSFRWTRESGMVDLDLGLNQVVRVSSDGSTIINSNLNPGRWTSETGFVPLPPAHEAVALGLSGDGSVVVGRFVNGDVCCTQAIRWTESGGAEPLFAGLGSTTVAWDISADGSVILADEEGDLGPFLWSSDDGIVFIGGPDLAVFDGGISDNGKVVFGRNNANGNTRAFRWTKDTGVVEIGPLPDGVNTSSARGASADGSIIVGNSLGSPQKVYIWDEIHGPRYLLDVLLNESGLGNDLAAWTLGVTRGISADGRTVIGHGTNPAGNTEAWIAYLGPAASIAGDYNANGTVDAADYVVWRKGLATGAYTQADYNIWRANFGVTAGSGSVTNGMVPEPATWATLLLGILATCARRRIRTCNL